MDMTEVFKTEFFRPLVVTFIPGATALIPYLFLIDHYFPGFVDLRTGNEIIAFTVMTLAILAVGMILEDLGSRIEVTLWSFIIGKSTTENEEWFKYLRTHFEKQPVGVTYLNEVLMRMKFENSLAPALIVMAFGLWLLKHVGYINAHGPIRVAIATAVVVAIYLLAESYEGAKVLIKVRREIISGVHIPAPLNAPAAGSTRASP